MVYLVFLPSLSSLGWEVFYQRHNPLVRLTSFPTGLEYSLVFFPNSPIGWEVFYQATFLPTPIRLTELISKREGNCNVMNKGPADHGLHVIQSYLNLIFLATAINSFSYHYNLIISTSYYHSLNPSITFYSTLPSSSSHPKTKALWSLQIKLWGGKIKP